MPTDPSPIVIDPRTCDVWITADGLTLTRRGDSTAPVVTIRRPEPGDLAGQVLYSQLAACALSIRAGTQVPVTSRAA